MKRRPNRRKDQSYRALFEVDDSYFHVTATSHIALSRQELFSLLSVSHVALHSIPHKIRTRFVNHSRVYTLDISVVGLKAIADLNRKFRGINKATDVLSFSRLSTSLPPSASPDVGDVILCKEVASQQAKRRRVPLIDELTLLTAHGILHLFGYDHCHRKDSRTMFRLQKGIITHLLKIGPRRFMPRA